MSANIITLVERSRESCEIHVGPPPHYVDGDLQPRVKRFTLNPEDADHLRSRLAQWLDARPGKTTDDGATADPAVTVQLARIDALEARLTCVEEALAKVNAAAADSVALHDRVFAEAAETTSSPSPGAPEPRIERFYDGAGIDAVVTFPCPDGNTSVRVGVWIPVQAHEKVGVTDARIIAEARKVLATMAGDATPTVPNATGLYDGITAGVAKRGDDEARTWLAEFRDAHEPRMRFTEDEEATLGRIIAAERSRGR
jgi:hypothetical protein